MLQIQDELEEFMHAIRQTDVAKKYDDVRERVMQDAQLALQIDEFRRNNYIMQMQTYPDQIMESSDHFAKEHEKFRENPLVQEYLEAELAYCRMLQDITTKILGVIPLELGEIRSWQ